MEDVRGISESDFRRTVLVFLPRHMYCTYRPGISESQPTDAIRSRRTSSENVRR